jgi:hypothetical protein
VRFLPKWFPGTHYAEFARRMRIDVDKFYNEPFGDVLQQVASLRSHKVPKRSLTASESQNKGVAKKSFLSKNIIESKAAGIQDDEIADQIKGAAAIFFSAGADTTAGTLTIFLRELVRRPEVLRKIQQEIDRVTGKDRLPTFDDMPDLPYLECVLQETLR